MGMIERVKKWVKYHIRWQSGFVVSFPCMWLFIDVWDWPLWLSIVAFQFVGSLVFYPIDHMIFASKKSDDS